MTLTLAMLLGTVLCDVCGQLCFKRGVGHETAAEPGKGVRAFLGGLLGSPWIVAGLLIYVVEFTLWFAALSMARLILGEHVSPRRWIATFAVAFGVVLVCWP
jgi:drug/metabolite transporter (DMT)-like permease